MTDDYDEPCMCGTDFTCLADEHECTCDGRQQFVCHDMRNEPHLVGCPRWGTPVAWHSTHVVDVESAYDAESVTSVYKCGTCYALVEAGDCEDHAAWHANLSVPR